jgi:UDP-N-acetylglucosamine 2-epimerase (non-hydrolysing)
MRDVTERTEGIDAGIALLVGTDKEKIVKSVRMLLSNKGEYNNMAKRRNPYGDGKSSMRIRTTIKKLLQ